jgi:xanthine dehydrogenase YagS FAD-binding subunit
MKSFEYAAPNSLADVTDLLGTFWGETEVMAGGTDLVTCLKQEITKPNRVVSLRNVSALKGISKKGDELRIGATTTLEECASHADVKKSFPSIVTAIRNIASPQILNTGTVGGDLCQRPRCWYFRNGHGLFAIQDGTALVPIGDNRYHAIFANDGPAQFVNASSLGPALIALGATMSVTGPKNAKRDIPAAEFFRTPKTEQERETVLKPNEVLTEIRVPLKQTKNATYEIRHRHGLDWPYVAAAVSYELKNGVATNVKVVLGHVAPTPWAATQAAQALEGKKIDAQSAEAAASAAVQGAKPLSGNSYKVQLVKAAVRRAIMATAQA